MNEPNILAFVALKRNRITQQEIARRCGVSPAVVSQVLNGRVRSRRISTEIANATNHTLAELFPEYENKQLS